MILKNSIITETELRSILEDVLEKSKGTGANGYDTYISSKKTEQVDKVDNLGKRKPGIERHHITPKFDGGLDSKENIILLTVKEHVIAHWLRWKVLGKRGDYTAFLFRIGDTEEALAQRNKAVQEARERDRAANRNFFSSTFQREMGFRGGPLGGSANTEAQFRARQQVGLTYGRLTGIRNQSSNLQEFVSNGSIWAFSEIAFANKRVVVKDRGKELFCLVTSKESFADVARSLNAFVPNSIPQNVASMHKLVNGERKQMYGWRIVNTLIRSEVREGIQDFYTQNANTNLLFEEDLLVNEGFE
uniref:Putative HNH homing endonuclease n=1 Tax=Chloromonas perforata TaxID=51730 RepID=A0A0S2LP96_9CHLO|nr:putative HNH homing endonuclease [Chloromonas perforata]